MEIILLWCEFLISIYYYFEYIKQFIEKYGRLYDRILKMLSMEDISNYKIEWKDDAPLEELKMRELKFPITDYSSLQSTSFNELIEILKHRKSYTIID